MRHILLAVVLVVTSASATPAQSLATATDRREAVRHYRAGQELLGSERWDRAVVEFRAAIALDALFVDAHYGLGQAFMGATRFASAVQAYNGCLMAARAIYGLRDRDRVGVDRQIDDQIRELKDAARRLAAQANPQMAAMKTLQIDIRIQDLERSRSSHPGAFEPPAGVMLALGSAHFRNGARDEAERHWTEATRVNPALGEAWNNLAVVYMQTARKGDALEAVLRAERAGFRVHPRLKDDIANLPAP